jgi:hypothetical protein
MGYPGITNLCAENPNAQSAIKLWRGVEPLTLEIE